MLAKIRVLSLCTSAVLALSTGCTSDSPTAAGPDAQFDHSGAEAGGAAQISGIGYYAEPGQCSDADGEGADYVLTLTGDLDGCHYVFIETASCSAGGAYSETGTETFVGLYNGAPGTFKTTYLFTAKYTDCDHLIGEVVGRCEHPLVAGSGEGVFEGATGRLDMKDDIETGGFPYRGHFRT